MPYTQARLTVTLGESEKDELQSKLTNAVGNAFSKPTAYIMTEIEDNCSLYMAGSKLEKGAYVSVSLLGTTTKQACEGLTQQICSILGNYGIDGKNIYVTYHPENLWGWNNMMF